MQWPVSDALLGVLIGGVIGFAGSYVVARLTNQAENERVDKQLTHERTMREREELREVIDGAIQTVHEGIYAAGTMRKALDTARHDLLRAQEAYEPAASELRQTHRLLNGYQSRLAIRLGVGSDLPEAVKECRVQIGVFRDIAPVVGSMPQRR